MHLFSMTCFTEFELAAVNGSKHQHLYFTSLKLHLNLITNLESKVPRKRNCKNVFDTDNVLKKSLCFPGAVFSVVNFLNGHPKGTVTAW